MKCRHCHAPLDDIFIDLGTAPPSNAFLRPQDLDRPEMHLPLKAYTCAQCHLVQIDEVLAHDALFSSDYVYFSSFSPSWLTHARRYVEKAVERLQLGPESLVMEVASNDGYLLQYVLERGIACVGIEPTASTAKVARDKGIESLEVFFGRDFARSFATNRRQADLVLGNNVLAHVPDINDFIAGLREVLAPSGTITVEFPHLLQLVRQCQFDTIYHEHFSYLAFHTVQAMFAEQGLTVWDVEELPTHGGSLRVWAQHATNPRPISADVTAILRKETYAGMSDLSFYRGMQTAANRIKDDLVSFLIDQKRAGKSVAGYGAAAKGNTLLNYAGIRPDLLPFVVDASPHKQGRYLPGSRIPVVKEDLLRQLQPDFVLLLPWNLRDEVTMQLSYIRDWGGHVVTAVPTLSIS